MLQQTIIWRVYHTKSMAALAVTNITDTVRSTLPFFCAASRSWRTSGMHSPGREVDPIAGVAVMAPRQYTQHLQCKGQHRWVDEEFGNMHSSGRMEACSRT